MHSRPAAVWARLPASSLVEPDVRTKASGGTLRKTFSRVTAVVSVQSWHINLTRHTETTVLGQYTEETIHAGL